MKTKTDTFIVVFLVGVGLITRHPAQSSSRTRDSRVHWKKISFSLFIFFLRFITFIFLSISSLSIFYTYFSSFFRFAVITLLAFLPFLFINNVYSNTRSLFYLIKSTRYIYIFSFSLFLSLGFCSSSAQFFNVDRCFDARLTHLEIAVKCHGIRFWGESISSPRGAFLWLLSHTLFFSNSIVIDFIKIILRKNIKFRTLEYFCMLIIFSRSFHTQDVHILYSTFIILISLDKLYSSVIPAPFFSTHQQQQRRQQW